MSAKKSKSPITKHARKPKNSYEEKRQLRKDIHEKVKMMKLMNVTVVESAVNRIIDDRKGKGDASDEVMESIRKDALGSDLAKNMLIDLNGLVDKIIREVDEGWVTSGHLTYVKCRLDALTEEMKNKI